MHAWFTKNILAIHLTRLFLNISSFFLAQSILNNFLVHMKVLQYLHSLILTSPHVFEHQLSIFIFRATKFEQTVIS